MVRDVNIPRRVCVSRVFPEEGLIPSRAALATSVQQRFHRDQFPSAVWFEADVSRDFNTVALEGGHRSVVSSGERLPPVWAVLHVNEQWTKSLVADLDE